MQRAAAGIVATMLLVVGGAVVDGQLGSNPDPTPDLPPNPHVAPSEQVLEIASITVEQSGSNWTVDIELENRVVESEPGNPVPVSDPVVRGTLPNGSTLCEGDLNAEIPPNGTKILTLSCSGLPLTFEARPNGQQTQYVEAHHTEVVSQVVGYLGQNETGHHWFDVGREGDGSRFLRPAVQNYVACRQRIEGLDVSDVPGPRPRFHEKYSIPAQDVEYLATVDTMENGSRSGNGSRTLPASLSSAGSGTITHEFDRATWFNVTDTLDDRDIRITDDFPLDAERVSVQTNLSRGCSDWGTNVTEYSGSRNVTLQYSVQTANATHHVRMVHNTNYSTPSLPHANRTIEVRRLNRSDLIGLERRESDTLWTHANVSGLDIPDATPRYVNVSEVPRTLQELFVRADRRTETSQPIYVRPYLVEIHNSLVEGDTRPYPSAREGVVPLGYPCGPENSEWFAPCDTTESSIILEQRTHFVVDYDGKLYYVLIRSDY